MCLESAAFGLIHEVDADKDVLTEVTARKKASGDDLLTRF